MAQTTISVGSFGRWRGIVDVRSQSVVNNRSVLRVRGVMFNDGNTTSFSNNQIAWSVSGTASRSGTRTFSVPAFGQLTFFDEDFTVDHNPDGTRSVSFNITLGATGTSTFGSGGTAVVSMTLPTIPVTPNTPTGVSATRLSDTSIQVSWTHQTSGARGVISRRINNGSWQTIYTMNTTSETFTNSSGLGANRKVDYRVAARVGSNQSGWSSPVTVYTTPNPPTGVFGVRSGDDIVVSATGFPPYATSYDVSDLSSLLAGNVSLPWTDVAPDPLEPHQYRVRGRIGSMTGEWSNPSPPIQVLAAPNPPTGLTPNGVVRAVDEDVRFEWVHNPVDASPQEEYQLEHRAVGAGSWTILTGTTDSFRDVSVPVGPREWRVITKGLYPGFSNWSAVATVEVIDRPLVEILQPEATWDSSVLPVEWSWFQEQDFPQSGWQLQLLWDDELVESRSGTGPTTTVTLNRRLTEGEWTVRVRAATGEVWSDWVEETFTVEFDEPLEPVLGGAWDEEQGGVSLLFGPVDDDGFPETVRVVLERSVDGELWEFVAETEETTNVIDFESPSSGNILYRAVSFTVEGASAETSITVEARSGAVWLSGGPGFEVTARLPFDPQVSVSAGRERALKTYAGRSVPVAVTGEMTSRVVSVSGTVLDRDVDTADVETLAGLAQSESDLFLFRDPDGRVIVGQISAIDLPRRFATSHPDGWEGVWSYSFTLTEAT